MTADRVLDDALTATAAAASSSQVIGNTFTGANGAAISGEAQFAEVDALAPCRTFRRPQDHHLQSRRGSLDLRLEASRESRGDVTAMGNGKSGSDVLTETSADDSAGQPNMVALAGANDDSGAAFTTGNVLPTTASWPPSTSRAYRPTALAWDLAEAPGREAATTTIVQHHR